MSFVKFYEKIIVVKFYWKIIIVKFYWNIIHQIVEDFVGLVSVEQNVAVDVVTTEKHFDLQIAEIASIEKNEFNLLHIIGKW